MMFSDEKMAVLAVLKKQATPLSLPEILALLPSDYAERTARRWLADLVSAGVVKRTGQKRGTRYFINESSTEQPAGHMQAASGSIFSQKSLEALAYVRQPLFRRQPVSYHLDWFNAYQPNQSYYFSPTELAELEESGLRQQSLEPAGTYARRIYDRLLIDLSYNSSRLEGNTYSLLDTKRLLVEGAAPIDKLDTEKVMILNHKEAIRYLVDSAPRTMADYDTVCTLHYLLSDGLVPVQYSGRVRDHGVRVGASTYIPWEDGSRLERQLQNILAKAAAIINPYEQSIFLLIHVAYLQAFTDVNKRTSRLSANIPLLQHNRVPLSFNAIEKDDYASAMLCIYERNEIKPIAELYRASYLQSCDAYDATAESLGFDAIRIKYRDQRRHALTEIITNQFIGNALDIYIRERAAEGVPTEDRSDFLKSLHEDMEALSVQRSAGLGVSREELNLWLKNRRMNS